MNNRASTVSAIKWGVAFFFSRDIMQFCVMLAMVRLIQPSEYGIAALSQSIIGIISVLSFGTFIQHALQIRDPNSISWQDHFTSGFVINVVLFFITLLIACFLWSTQNFKEIANPLAVLSLVFLVEIFGSLRHRMLEAQHQWMKYRVLAMVGTVVAMITGLLLALQGYGILALVIQPVIFPLPAAIDLLLIEKWRPKWSWSWNRYRPTAVFGINRIGAGMLLNSRQFFEQAVLGKIHDFATLGMFTRANGLANLAAGRIGSLAPMVLYPILTRAEKNSEHFRHMAGLLFRGVCWVTIPAATFVILHAEILVNLLYGDNWQEVAVLLPSATLAISFNGLLLATFSLLLGNGQERISLKIDFVRTIFALVGIFIFIPIGLQAYLYAQSGIACFALVIALFELFKERGINLKAIGGGFLPAVCASAIAAFSIFLVPGITYVKLIISFPLFSLIYLLILRVISKAAMGEFLHFMPGGIRLAKLLRC